MVSPVRPGALLAALLALLLSVLPCSATAAVVGWEGPVSSERVAATLFDDAGTLATFVTWDGAPQSRFGVLADTDPRPGWLSVSIDLRGTEGGWRLEQAGEVLLEQAVPPTHEGRPVALPSGATGVVLFRDSGDLAAVAWDRSRSARLAVEEDTWTGRVLGLPALEARSDPGSLAIQPRMRLWPRPAEPSRVGLVRWGLLPVTLVLLGTAVLAVRRPPPGWRWGVLAAGTAAALAVGPVLCAPGSTLLDAGGAFADPPNSVATIRAIADTLPRATDVSTAFSLPDGHSWLVLGSSWAAYLVAAPLAGLTTPLVAHNLTLALLLFALGLSAWLLATDLGARPGAAVFAAGGAVLAPRLLGELDQLSLDRAWLFPVPLFLLALDRAAREPGWRWPVFAGAALAALLLGQTHYGLYLATAAPLLVLPRLVGPHPLRRLGRLAAAGCVAAVLAAPQLWVLLEGTAQTALAADGPRLLHSADDLLHPVPANEAVAWLDEWSARGGDGGANRPLDQASDRLLAAVSNSLDPADVVAPGTTLTGGGIYLWILGLAFLVARARGAVLRIGLDTALLLVWALGPFLQTAEGALGAPLPYYAAHLFVPGFESLKHPVRASFLAATLSSVPLALGLTGLTRRLREPAVAVLSALLLAAALGIHWRLPSEVVGKPHWAPPGVGKDVVLAWDLDPPLASSRPPAPALAGLAGQRAVVLPHREPLPAEAYLPCLQAGLSLVNAPPDGASAGGGVPSWWETNGLLNQLAWVSGSTRPPRPTGAPWAADLAELKAAGVGLVVVFEDLLPAPGLADDTASVLSNHGTLLRREDGVAVWTVP